MTIIKPKHYYLIGIGGISMSGLAFLLKECGYRVSGSDIAESEMTQRLKRQGILVNIGHQAENITSDIDAVIYSAAIGYSNPELKQAKKLGISVLKRSEAIGKFMQEKEGIAIAGMHGKTTTTCLVTLILQNAGFDPSALVGTELKEIGGNYRVGKGKYFVAEACEYYNAFLDFHPKMAILTNIEAEHLDYFGNLKKILQSFSRFVKNLPPTGLLIACQDNKNNLKMINKAHCRVITYGFDPKADIVAFNIALKAGYTTFDIRYSNKIIKGFELYIPGKHNILNALASIALALELKIDPGIIKKSLKEFKGASRRFEIIDKIGGITLISDYAHHPSEIKTTLEGAKIFYPKSRIITIFQPHQYKRTKLLLKDFGQSFSNASLVIVPNIYKVAGRDTQKDIKSVSPERLVEEIKKNKVKARFIEGFFKTTDYVSRITRPGDIVIIMGAGDIYKINDLLINRLKHKEKCEKFFQGYKGKIKKNVKLAPYTTLKIGGLADLFAEVNQIAEFKNIIIKAHQLNLPLFILGNGSNILVSDYGFRGLVIKNNCRKIEIRHNRLIAESGALLSEIIKKAFRASLSGIEFLAGIPGTIGGAIVNNAGVPSRSISDVLTRALIINKKGEVLEVDDSFFKFKYRDSCLKRKEPPGVILKAELQLTWQPPAIINQKIKEFLEERRKKQPLKAFSVGSIFKNPSPQKPAGYLLEKADAKNKRVGKAYVSSKHANFILVNKGAKAQDVYQLIQELKNLVKKKFGIVLEEEIQYIGEWENESKG